MLKTSKFVFAAASILSAPIIYKHFSSPYPYSVQKPLRRALMAERTGEPLEIVEAEYLNAIKECENENILKSNSKSFGIKEKLANFYKERNMPFHAIATFCNACVDALQNETADSVARVVKITHEIGNILQDSGFNQESLLIRNWTVKKAAGIETSDDSFANQVQALKKIADQFNLEHLFANIDYSYKKNFKKLEKQEFLPVESVDFDDFIVYTEALASTYSSLNQADVANALFYRCLNLVSQYSKSPEKNLHMAILCNRLSNESMNLGSVKQSLYWSFEALNHAPKDSDLSIFYYNIGSVLETIKDPKAIEYYEKARNDSNKQLVDEAIKRIMY